METAGVNWWVVGPAIVAVVDLIIKVVALGTVPTNRRPSSSIAWLLLIVVLPIFGLLIFLLIGSPFVRGRRAKVQVGANARIADAMAGQPALPASARMPVGVTGLLDLNRRLTALPAVLGTSHGVIGEMDEFVRVMAEAIDAARSRVHLEYFIMAWDDTTGPVFEALARAVQRGVKVRALYDHVSTRSIPGYPELNDKLTAAGIEWHPMMPIMPLKGQWRRPDLRNHRKLLVIDGIDAFMGSANLITTTYLKPKNIKAGRHWKDLNVRLSGEIVTSLELVFATDWFSETGERLDLELSLGATPAQRPPAQRPPAQRPAVQRPAVQRRPARRPANPTNRPARTRCSSYRPDPAIRPSRTCGCSPSSSTGPNTRCR